MINADRACKRVEHYERFFFFGSSEAQHQNHLSYCFNNIFISSGITETQPLYVLKESKYQLDRIFTTAKNII